MHYAYFIPLANASGAPAISTPAGLSKQRSPIGSHFFGKQRYEKTLLELVIEIEKAQPWPKIMK